MSKEARRGATSAHSSRSSASSSRGCARVRQTETASRACGARKPALERIASLEAERRGLRLRRPAFRALVEQCSDDRLWTARLARQGPLVYTFGRAVQANTPPSAGRVASGSDWYWRESVAAGLVVQRSPVGHVRLTVILDHGGGDYTIYGSLARADVREGQTVIKGTSLATYRDLGSELPPHCTSKCARRSSRSIPPNGSVDDDCHKALRRAGALSRLRGGRVFASSAQRLARELVHLRAQLRLRAGAWQRGGVAALSEMRTGAPW